MRRLGWIEFRVRIRVGVEVGVRVRGRVRVRVRVRDRVRVRGNWGWPTLSSSSLYLLTSPYISLCLPISPHPELVLAREHEDRLHAGHGAELIG